MEGKIFCQGPSSKKWKAEISDPCWYFQLYNSKDLAVEEEGEIGPRVTAAKQQLGRTGCGGRKKEKWVRKLLDFTLNFLFEPFIPEHPGFFFHL